MDNENRESKVPVWPRIAKITLIFAVAGMLAGFSFATVTSFKSLQTFWFVKSDKFWIPRLPYFAALSLILLIGLIFAFTLSQIKFRFLSQQDISFWRKINATCLTGLSTTILYLISPLITSLDKRCVWQ